MFALLAVSRKVRHRTGSMVGGSMKMCAIFRVPPCSRGTAICLDPERVTDLLASEVWCDILQKWMTRE